MDYSIGRVSQGNQYFPSKLQKVEGEIPSFDNAPIEDKTELSSSESLPESHETTVRESKSFDQESLGILKRIALIGLSALSLLGGIIGNAPLMAQNVRPAEATRVITLPEAQKEDDNPTKPSADDSLSSTFATTEKTGEVRKNVNPSTAEVRKLIEASAKKQKVPKEIVMAIAWHESGWRQFDDDGAVVQGINRSRKGKISSIDWGIMQINDKSHPGAFPMAKDDIEYNINYGVKLLRSLYKENGNWHDAIAAYNGSTEYARKINHVMDRKPWPREKVRFVQKKQSPKAEAAVRAAD